MADNHPITPPPELVELWHNEAMLKGFRNKGSYYGHELAIQAAHWAADQELEACVNYVDNTMSGNRARALRAARRPKPPSLADQALIAHRRIWNEGINHTDCGLILRALERLQELEGND